MYFVSFMYSSIQIKHAAKEFSVITGHTNHVTRFIHNIRRLQIRGYNCEIIMSPAEYGLCVK